MEAPENQNTTAPPQMKPSSTGASVRLRCSSPALVSNIMIEKIIVVAPTTAVPINTGLAVALKVLPAPSFSSNRCLARSKLTVMPKSCLTSACSLGTCSISDSSYTDCALSVTGPYESTAMVTGPIPKNPKATKPNAKTEGATISAANPRPLTAYAIAISATMLTPSQ